MNYEIKKYGYVISTLVDYILEDDTIITVDVQHYSGNHLPTEDEIIQGIENRGVIEQEKYNSKPKAKVTFKLSPITLLSKSVIV